MPWRAHFSGQPAALAVGSLVLFNCSCRSKGRPGPAAASMASICSKTCMVDGSVQTSLMSNKSLHSATSRPTPAAAPIADALAESAW
jgi:hypothetical protein